MTFNVPSRPEIESLVPYVPGKSAEDVARELGIDSAIKLASNENALGSAVDFGAVFQEVSASVYRYPDSAHLNLRAAIAAHYLMNSDEVIMGNGSDEVIQMIALAFISPGDEVLSSASAFSEYRFAAQIAGAIFTEVPMQTLSVDIEALAAQASGKTRVIFVSNPHNPTGTAFSHKMLESALKRIPSTCLFVLDEAYAEYADGNDFPRFRELITRFPNLMVLRTFSKIYGLAGIRIGYGLGCSELIGCLNKVRQPFNINKVSLVAAAKAIENQSFVEKSRDHSRKEKNRISRALADQGILVSESEANFLCIPVRQNAVEVANALMSRGIIVRPLNSFGLPNHIRVTMGTEHENDLFLNAFLSVSRS